MPSHLILGNSTDYHAVAVAWALREIGHTALIWDGVGVSAEQRLMLDPASGDGQIWMHGAKYERFHSVWHRRPIRHGNLDHIADHARTFVVRECAEAYECLATLATSMSPFVVGGIGTRHLTKARQLALARRLGFRVPATIITDSFEAVCAFVERTGRVAVKPFSPHYWRHVASDTLRFASTSLIESTSELDRDTVEASPSIYQQFIEKALELRVTVIGRTVHAAKITKRDGGYFVDARMFIEGPDTSVDAVKLDNGLEQTILAFMDEAGLSYGCLDIVVDRQGDAHFLEVNPSGQFLFVEQLVPELPLLASFAGMLANQGRAGTTALPTHISTRGFEASGDFHALSAPSGNGPTSFSAQNPFYTELA
ncbi:hypothetical protein J2T07_000425 [Luteibacter jiangsuensis]|uniref:ATP-grasp domain-containing protein n=1 Tax=Luteibacter jiangsuensis TaxID=637577 RepID=A0ABT9STE4_9GAMM|nr:hypothetical protein [Luteibacter jiangsuensis]MDQ0008266.1 hypothetical protein [Luteibacter jiangsuensis]